MSETYDETSLDDLVSIAMLASNNTKDGIAALSLKEEFLFNKVTIPDSKKRYTTSIPLKESKIITPKTIPNTSEKTHNKINIVPSDTELQHIQNNNRISSDMKKDLCQLHKTDINLKNLILQEMETVEKLAKQLVLSGIKFDFSWTEYILRDVVVKETNDIFSFKQNLRMLGLEDLESSEILSTMLNADNDNYMTILLYYGAPSDSDTVLSGVRFIDVVAINSEEITQRERFFRYLREV